MAWERARVHRFDSYHTYMFVLESNDAPNSLVYRLCQWLEASSLQPRF